MMKMAVARAEGEQSSVKNVFIRGSVVRYVHLPGQAVDTALLEDATRRGKHPPFFPSFLTSFPVLFFPSSCPSHIYIYPSACPWLTKSQKKPQRTQQCRSSSTSIKDQMRFFFFILLLLIFFFKERNKKKKEGGGKGGNALLGCYVM